MGANVPYTVTYTTLVYRTRVVSAVTSEHAKQICTDELNDEDIQFDEIIGAEMSENA